ncbi:hypothetical protein AWV80_35365 [Cupriavidus sp. UYMU48A]|nr:hypothetical protein AWV80_35365 [Cupriavidus sp. UYMU48A]
MTIKTQPVTPAQTCSVNAGNGTMEAAEVSNVAIVCSVNAYRVGGTLSGLSGGRLVLQDNAGDDLLVSANGVFTFSTPVASGADYLVTVNTQPSVPAQTCTVTAGSGKIANAAVNGVAVTCSPVIARFAYVLNITSASVSAYAVNATIGALSAVGSPVATGMGPRNILDLAANSPMW